MNQESVLTPTEPDSLGPRLTLRRVARDIAHHFFDLESGWLRTARELTVSPGPMIRRYVDGHRGVYANPFAYLVLASAVSIVVQNVVGFHDRIVATARADTMNSPLQMEFANRFTELIFQNSLYVSFGILVPIALLIRVLYRRSGYNLAESLVFALYAGGHTALLGVVVIPILMLLPPSYGVQGFVSVGFAILYLVWAARGFFLGRIFVVAIKMAIAYLIAYAVFMAVLMVAVVAYILMIMVPSSSGEPWDLVTATDYEAIPVIEKLLADGADVNTTLQRTSLHAAAANGNLEIVELLIEHGADVNLQDIHGRIPLVVALAEHQPEVARRLAEEPTDVTVRTTDGGTVLTAAVRAEDAELTRWALERGTEIDAVRPEKNGATALMIAAAKGSSELVRLLLAAGADPSITNHEGKTALDLAKGREVRDLLRKAILPAPADGAETERTAGK